MGDNSGSIRKVTLDGTTFDVYADSDVSSKPGTINEMMATSGRNIKKITKQVAEKEGIVIAANPAEYEVLKGLHAKIKPFPMSITFADGSVHRASGGINLESWTSMENKATIKLQPVRDFEAFLAS